MPYSSIADLPEPVKSSLPQHGQEIYMAAYNSAAKQGKDDVACAKIAWAAVGKKYEKGEDGMWRMIGTSAVFSMEIPNNLTVTEWLPVAKVGQKTTFSDGIIRSLTKDFLQKTVNTWNGGKITKNHNELVAGLQIGEAKFEDPFLYMKFDPKTHEYVTCEKSSGRSIEISATEFDDTQTFDGFGVGLSVLFPPHTPACNRAMGCFERTEGTMAKMTKEDMDKMLEFMKENPGSMDKETMDKMYAAMEAGSKKEYTKSMLKDLQAHPEMMDDEMKSMMKGMGAKFENNIQETEMTEEQLKAQITDLTANFEKKAAEVQTLQDELASSKARLAEFEKKEAEHLKSEIKAEFQAIVDSGKIPAGKIHKPEDKAALEAMFETEPRKFAVLLASFQQPEGTGKVGAEFHEVGTDEEAKEDAQAVEELREMGVRKIKRSV